MTWIQVTRPTNQRVLARFELFTGYQYRLCSGNCIKVGIDYAWCSKCDAFVEAEMLWEPHQIDSNYQNLLLSHGDSPEQRERSRAIALEWRENRISHPKCLSCGSMFGITKIKSHTVTEHPNGDGTIIISSDGTLGGCLPDPRVIYFDPDGRRISDQSAV